MPLTTSIAAKAAMVALSLGPFSGPVLRTLAPHPVPAHAKQWVASGRTFVGKVSWYGGRWRGRPTAYGERFNPRALTLASRHLAYNTRVRITNLHNGRSVVGRVNDYGPRPRGRIGDLSEAMANAIGMRGAGIARVRMEVLRRH